MKLVTVLIILAVVVLLCVLGALGALAVYLWGLSAERREARRRERERLRGVLR